MTRYQTAMVTLSNALAKARAPSEDHPTERHSPRAALPHADPTPIPRGGDRRIASHRRPSLLVRAWRAISSWTARRDFNSHQ
jgi:hypothetical protein